MTSPPSQPVSQSVSQSVSQQVQSNPVQSSQSVSPSVTQPLAGNGLAPSPLTKPEGVLNRGLAAEPFRLSQSFFWRSPSNSLPVWGVWDRIVRETRRMLRPFLCSPVLSCPLLSSPLLSSLLLLSSSSDHDNSADMCGAIFGLSGDRVVKAVLRGQESVSQSVSQSVRPCTSGAGFPRNLPIAKTRWISPENGKLLSSSPL